MSVAVISLLALVTALVASCVSTLNVGFLAIVLAWLVGVYAAGMSVDQVLAGFPASLFLTLVGIALLFAQAQTNGTLEHVARRAVGLCRGRAGLVPGMFFGLAAVLSSIGAGNIASNALLAPVGMAAGGRFGIPPFLTAMMIANGASAGSLSPVAPAGVVTNAIVAKFGLADAGWVLFANNFVVHTIVAFAGYLILGGGKLLFARSVPAPAVVGVAAGSVAASAADPVVGTETTAFEPRHQLTMAVITALVVSVLVFGLNVGMGAFAGAAVLTIFGAADEGAAVRAMPWKVIMMVSGVSVLIALIEKTGGMALFTGMLASMATPATSTLVAAFFTGLISIYSSTSGVVLPALLPTVPGLIERMGGGDALALVSSICVGGHLVDVSSLSTAGALCLAAAPPGTDTRALFNQLLAWGLSMSVVGALVCWVAFGWL
jgi:di/tricarboxylate transporter